MWYNAMVHRGIAQLVEYWSPKPRVVGSSPSAPAKKTRECNRTPLFFWQRQLARRANQPTNVGGGATFLVLRSKRRCSTVEKNLPRSERASGVKVLLPCDNRMQPFCFADSRGRLSLQFFNIFLLSPQFCGIMRT